MFKQFYIYEKVLIQLNINFYVNLYHLYKKILKLKFLKYIKCISIL